MNPEPLPYRNQALQKYDLGYGLFIKDRTEAMALRQQQQQQQDAATSVMSEYYSGGVTRWASAAKRRSIGSVSQVSFKQVRWC